MGGRTYARAYRTQSFRGFTYVHYVPRIYYQPLFYTWAFNPWSAPVYFNWGWDVAPWYSHYGPYFRPARVYTSSALWLTDFLLAENLKLAYESQQQDGEALADGEQTSALSPEIKQLIAEQVKQELESERAAASVTNDSEDAVATRSEAVPEALDPTRRVFVVSTGLDLETQSGQACSLTPGDIILRGGDAVNESGQVTVTVLASKPGNCPVNSATAIDLASLVEMHNQFREHIDSGLSMLAVNHGKGGLPTAPAAAPRLVNAGLAEADPGVTSVLLDQQQAAEKIEAEARGASQR
jgi:hypothetical protein